MKRLRVPKKRGHVTAWRVVTPGSTRGGQEAEGAKGKLEQELSLWFPWEEMSEAGLLI